MEITVLFIAALIAAAAAYTWFRVRHIDRQMTADGAFADVDGVRLHYHFYPAREPNCDDPVLVFLHGASGNSEDTRLAFLGALKDRYPLLFVDRPGLGFSQGKPGRHDLPGGQARAIAKLLERLDIKAAVVIGHSLGGAVTAALGLADPERVRGMAFVAPVSHEWPGGVNWYYSVASLPLIGSLFCWTLTLPIGGILVPRAMSNVFYPDRPPPDYAGQINLPLLFRPASFRANARQIAFLKPAVVNQSKRYAELSQPTLVVTGTKDTVVWPSIHCEGLLRDLPNVQLLFLDEAGHMPHHTHTDTIVKALERLIHRVRCEEQARPGQPRVHRSVGQH